ncbi:unnamed protein product [Rhizophagus irregularis]|nr:unnamed protein product [Rhizophagus irregularis]
MVKITRKILTQKASLRQAVRSNIGKSINLRKIIPHNEKSNLALHSNSNMSNFSEYNIQNIIPNENSSINRDSLSRNNNSFLSQSINNNKSEYNINNNDQEKYFQKLNGYENRNIIQEENASTSENEERDYYFHKLIDDESNDIGDNDQENYNQRLDECEDSDKEDISFIFKNKYDGFQNASFYHGEAKPYFPNKSVMLMFIWYTKYMIGTRTYQDLVKILQHPDFCASDLPQSITTLKQMHHDFPLMTLNSHNVKINPMDIPSTSVSVKEDYTFSIFDYIQQFYQAGNFILYNSQEEAAVWLTKNHEAINVDCVVVHHVKIWLENLPEPENYDYRIEEILYIHNNRSKIRQIHQQHQLPNQHNFQRLSFPLNLQHLKFFIDLYYNDFGAFDKVIISGGLGMCIADLPQGNDLAGIRRHNTDHGYCTCEVTQEDLNNTYFDIQLNGRYCHIMDCYYKEIKQTSTKSAKENIAKQHGLCLKKNILDNLIHNPYIQVPQNPYHCLAGLVRHLFDKTFKSMNDEGHKIFHYKTEIVNRIKDEYSLSNRTQVLSIIVDCWVKMAKACKAVFKSTYILIDEYNDYILLKKRLEQVTEDVYKNFSAIIQRHVNYYDSIQFTVHLESDVYVNITLRVGKAIDVEVADSHGEQSYALIRVIMIHQDDSGNNNPFLLIDWFYRNGNVDSVTGFPIYGLQKKR